MKHCYFALAIALSAMPCLVPVAKAQPAVPVPVAKTSVVYITGEVVKPGAYKVNSTDTLSSLLALAGGATRTAGLDEVRLHRAGAGYIVNLPTLKIQVARGKAEDLFLRNGDVFTVPTAIKRVYVMGAVAKPGLYVIPTGKAFSVNDVLALAGGAQTGDKTAKIQLLRESVAGLNSTFVEGKSSVQSGDTIYVIKSRTPKDTNPKFRLLAP